MANTTMSTEVEDKNDKQARNRKSVSFNQQNHPESVNTASRSQSLDEDDTTPSNSSDFASTIHQKLINGDKSLRENEQRAQKFESEIIAHEKKMLEAITTQRQILQTNRRNFETEFWGVINEVLFSPTATPTSTTPLISSSKSSNPPPQPEEPAPPSSSSSTVFTLQTTEITPNRTNLYTQTSTLLTHSHDLLSTYNTLLKNPTSPSHRLESLRIELETDKQKTIRSIEVARKLAGCDVDRYLYGGEQSRAFGESDRDLEKEDVEGARVLMRLGEDKIREFTSHDGQNNVSQSRQGDRTAERERRAKRMSKDNDTSSWNNTIAGISKAVAKIERVTGTNHSIRGTADQA